MSENEITIDVLLKQEQDYQFESFSNETALVNTGKLGHISFVKADFCFKAKADFHDRLYNQKLGGGSLLDTGVYVISLAQMLMKELPQNISTQMTKTSTCVDGTGLYILGYSGNRHAMLSSFILNKTPNNAVISGGAVILIWKVSGPPDRQ